MTMQPSDLRDTRRTMGLTQGELAERLGLTPQFIGMMERGEKAIEPRTALAVLYLADHPGAGSVIPPRLLCMHSETPLLERVARALCRSDGKEPDVGPAISIEKQRGAIPDSVPNWKRYTDQARAVLEAIREPSEEMIKAGYREQDATEGSLKHSYIAMIDAALSQGDWNKKGG